MKKQKTNVRLGAVYTYECFNKGITLIALVITIIVLLILVGVTLNALTGENGVLNQATTSKEKTARAETIEKAKLAIAEEQSIRQTGKLTNAQIKDALRNSKLFKDESINDLDETKISDVEYMKVTELVTIDGKDIITLEEILKNMSLGNGNTDFTGINYPDGKTEQTVEVGDDITIGTEETGIEKFMVINKTDTKITAMPYYNITLDETAPIQSSSAGTIAFATGIYWKIGGADIDMTDSRNNIQKYIDAYQTTLTNLGATNVNTRIARIAELSGLTGVQKNPGRKGYFWVGSSSMNYYTDVRYVDNGGSDAVNMYNNSYGVRPVIDINI